MTPHKRATIKAVCLKCVELARSPHALEEWGNATKDSINVLPDEDVRDVRRAYSRKMAKLCHEEARGAV